MKILNLFELYSLYQIGITKVSLFETTHPFLRDLTEMVLMEISFGSLTFNSLHKDAEILGAHLI